MKWEYRRFKTYGEFMAFLNRLNGTNWNLHSWQDLRHGVSYTDIFAVFTHVIVLPGSGVIESKLPEAK